MSDQNSEFEYIEYERIAKIQNVIHEYGEENFAISYSGGKDSNVVSTLIDLALPDNKIPRVYVNTGIELVAVRQFVEAKAKGDSRFHIIMPQKKIKDVLETYGYPFKSKDHSGRVYRWYTAWMTDHIKQYIERPEGTFYEKHGCPHILRYQFTEENKLLISDRCCLEMKEKPLDAWQKMMHRPIAITGIRSAEGGRRRTAVCLAFAGGKLKSFQPLAPIKNDWEEWFIEKHKIKLPYVYYPPYSLRRTGCKGCPFNVEVQAELDTLQQFWPQEERQCEIIWAPVYAEYRRLGYRLRGGATDADCDRE